MEVTPNMHLVPVMGRFADIQVYVIAQAVLIIMIIQRIMQFKICIISIFYLSVVDTTRKPQGDKFTGDISVII